MEMKNLRKHIRALVTLGETEAPVISCYLNLESGVSGYRKALDERIGLLRKSLDRDTRRYFEEALSRIETFIATKLLPDAKGAAIFSRGGDQPFFRSLQFRVPLPNWFGVDSAPNIYHLVELKDTYPRFVILFSTRERACIMEVNLGDVTEIWEEHPELHEQTNRVWTREHYQHHRKELEKQFITDKINILGRLISARGYTHLILAGDQRMTSRVRNVLPKHLASKLVDIVVASERDRLTDVVSAALVSFVERIKLESQTVVERLHRQINTHGLAVIGTVATLNALKWGQADMLVLDKSYDPGQGWMCEACKAISLNRALHNICPECGSEELRDLNVKEEMVRMAERSGCRVEIVDHNDVLMRFGGVGCLLRYRMPA